MQDSANLENWEQEQSELAKKVIIPPFGSSYQAQINDLILALDIQYQGDTAFIAGNLQYWQGENIGNYVGKTEVKVPYLPGYFCFREGPPLLKFVHKLLEMSELIPKVIVVDGHGIAHPRRFGVACWLGLATQIPTLGCAKDTLVQYEGELADNQGSTQNIYVENEIAGYVLRSQTGIKPIYISPGHLIHLEACKSLIINLLGEYRIPDMLRYADQAARAYAKGETLTNSLILNDL